MKRSKRRAEERARGSLADCEDWPRYGCTGYRQRGVDLELVERACEPEQLRPQRSAEPASVVKEPEMQPV